MGYFTINTNKVLGFSLSKLSVAFIGILSTSAYANEATGLAWLQAQSQDKVDASSVASQLQSLSETSRTIHELANTPTSFDIKDLQKKKFSTESLVRFALINHFQQGNEATKTLLWSQLKNRQNDDGGFNHRKGWQSNPLDTAYLLLTLAETDYLANAPAQEKTEWQNKIARALNYLISQQREDGSYQIIKLEKLYVSSYVLSTLSKYAQEYPQLVPSIQKLVTYLKNSQVQPAKWSNHPKGLFVDALVAESLHPYTNGDNSIQTAFKQRAMDAQQADGSWQDDMYVTAVVLDSLKKQSETVLSPVASNISLSVVDAETGILLSGVNLISTSNSKQDISATSNSAGILLVNGIRAGRYTFKLYKDGYAPISFNLFFKNGELLNLGQVKLSRAAQRENGQIQGIVTDKKTQSIIAGANIKVVLLNKIGQPLTQFQPIETISNDKGEYQVVLTSKQQQASNGHFKITAMAVGYLPVQGHGIANSGAVAMFRPRLVSQAQSQVNLIGKVVDEKGNPISGVSIISTSHPKQTKTDGTGKFAIEVLGTGTQKWMVHKNGYNDTSLSTFVNGHSVYQAGTVTLYKTKLSDPDNPNSDPIRPAIANIQVFAKDKETGKRISNVMVIAEKLDANGNVIQTQSFTNDIDPQFNAPLVISRISTGTWRVTVSHPSFVSQTKTIQLTAKQTFKYNLELELKPYIVSATVVDSQTNLPISNAPIKVKNADTAVELYQGVTDSTGHFVLPKAIDDRKISIEVTPKDYLPTTRYANREFITTTNIEMGEIRLRPKSAEVILPDLKITEIDSTKLTTDQQSLNVSGSITAKVVNKGNTDVNQSITLTAFEDKNYNKKLDKDEQILGTAKLTNPLAYQKDNADDTHAKVSINLTGKTQFREAPIAVIVDSDSQLAEKDEKNNVRYTSDTAEIKPKVGTLEPEVVWHWKPTKDTPYPEYDQVVASPMVVPLKDTNNNGVIDRNDERFVIFTSYTRDRYDNANGVLRIVNAKDGSEYKSFGRNESNGYTSAPSGNVSVADLNKDGLSEIVVTSQMGISCYDIENGFLWHTDIVDSYNSMLGMNYSAASIFDVDNDGYPEIIIGKNILDRNGGIVYQDSPSWEGYIADIVNPFHWNGGSFMISNGSIFDLKQHKQVSILGKPSWYIASAILNADNDASPEVVIASTKGLSLHKFDGTQIWGGVNITSINAGSPLIADMDGDSKPDIGIATEDDYIVFRSDGSKLWSIPIEDYSSSTTSSTVFDFENDGKAEVLYSDERYFRIMDGATGKIRYELPNLSGTLLEAPVVADGDNDGHADIFLISNNYPYPFKGTTGVRMLSGKNKDWANTRHIWNQHNYHITNINDDMTVPAVEEPSWLVHNTYRLNTIPNQNATAASDLTTSYIRIKDNSIIGDSSFTARIGNAGGKPVAKGTPVSFYRVPKINSGSTTAKPVLLGTVKLTKDLVGGNIAQSYEDVTLPFKGSLADFGEIVIVANDAGAGLDSATGIPVGQTADTTKVVQEYSRGNNTARLAVDGGFVALSLSGSLDNTKYTSNKEVSITAIPKNLGSFTSSPIVKIQILDDAGNVIATLPEQTVNLTSALIPDAGNSKTVVQKWNTGTNRVGNYTARITLWRKPLLSSVTGAEQELVATVNKPFSIVAGSDTGDGSNTGIVATTQSNITTDKASYTANDLVTINSRIQNTTNNQMATKRDIIVEVKDSTGKTIFTQQYSYDELPPNALKDEPFQITLKDAKAGTYTVTQTTKAPDGSQGMQVNSTRFSVADSSQTGIGIAGTLTADKTQVELGDTVELNWSINNTGDVALTQLPLKVALFKGNADKPFTTLPINPADISKGGSISQSVNWTAVGADKDQITAILVAGFKDDTGTVVDKGLAVTNFTLIEPQIEVEINPADTKHAEPLLVYYGCEEGWKTFYQNSSYGAFQFPCFNERANVLTGYLNRLQVPYKLVKRPEHFADQLQSGLYEQVWLLGAIEELRPHTRKELTELSHLGDNLVMDAGMNSWVNQDLYPLTGTKFKNRLLLKDGSMMLAPSFMSVIDRFSPDNTIANTPLVVSSRSQAGHPFYSSWAVQLQPQAGSSVWANYQGQIKKILPSQQQKEPVQGFPAIISQRYGNGQPVALGFDLINSLKQASKANIIKQHNWEATLKALLASRTVQAATDYVPQDVVHVPVQINNKGNRNKTIKVEIDLPTGANWLGNQGGINGNGTPYVQTGSTIRYEVAINGKQNLDQLLSIRLPNTAGAHAVRVTLSDAKGKQLAQQEMRYLVRDINSRFTAIHNTIKAWNVLGTNGFLKLTAKTNATNINTHLHTGVKQLAVYEASRLANKLRLMQEKDKSNELQQLRYEVDELLRALQIDWYVDRKGYVPLP